MAVFRVPKAALTKTGLKMMLDLVARLEKLQFGCMQAENENTIGRCA
jgi:hypothetical protein